MSGTGCDNSVMVCVKHDVTHFRNRERTVKTTSPLLEGGGRMLKSKTIKENCKRNFKL